MLVTVLQLLWGLIAGWIALVLFLHTTPLGYRVMYGVYPELVMTEVNLEPVAETQQQEQNTHEE